MTTVTTPASAAAESKSTEASQRLMSLDALRGFDMFWIIGADALVYALHRMSDNPITRFLADQLEHAEWAGFHFYDLIFPMFVFIMGASTVFSLTKAIEKAGRSEAMKRLLSRSVLLFVVALLYSGGFTNPWPDMRLLGVLNRIALCYFFGGMIFIYCKPKAMVGIAVGLLVGYWALMTYVPIRDIRLEKKSLAQLSEAAGDAKTAALFRKEANPSTTKDNPAWQAAQMMFNNTTARVTGKYDPGYNVANHFDFQYLPGKKWDNFYDPEGFISTIPAIATALLGIFAGLLLKSTDFCDKWKLIYLFSFGLGGVLLGFLWGMQFPVVKKIWTSSFVLVAGGYSAMLLGTFYLVVDVLKYQKWCQPFVWIGMNSITIYITSNLIGGFRKLGGRFVGGSVREYFESSLGKGSGDLIVAIVGLTLAFLFVRFLYQRKIFLRV